MQFVVYTVRRIKFFKRKQKEKLVHFFPLKLMGTAPLVGFPRDRINCLVEKATLFVP